MTQRNGYANPVLATKGCSPFDEASGQIEILDVITMGVEIVATDCVVI